MSVFSAILFFLVAAVSAYLAERWVPNNVPGGFITSIIVGATGAWLGGNTMGHFGPELVGVSLIPCIFVSAILVFVLSLVSRGFHQNA